MGSTKKGLKLRRLVVSEIPNPWLSEVQKVMALQSVILSGTVTASSAAPESLKRKESRGGCPHPGKISLGKTNAEIQTMKWKCM